MRQSCCTQTFFSSVGIVKIYKGYFILGVLTSEREVLALKNLVHILQQKCSKKNGVNFSKLFESNNNGIFLSVSFNKNLPFVIQFNISKPN